MELYRDNMNSKYSKLAWAAPLSGILLFFIITSAFTVKLEFGMVLFLLTTGVGVIVGAIVTLMSFSKDNISTDIALNGKIGLIIIMFIFGYIIFYVSEIVSMGSIG